MDQQVITGIVSSVSGTTILVFLLKYIFSRIQKERDEYKRSQDTINEKQDKQLKELYDSRLNVSVDIAENTTEIFNLKNRVDKLEERD